MKNHELWGDRGREKMTRLKRVPLNGYGPDSKMNLYEFPRRQLREVGTGEGSDKRSGTGNSRKAGAVSVKGALKPAVRVKEVR